MKKLLLLAPLLLAGCATNYDAYVEANIKVAEARARAETEKYKAMAAIASTGDAAAKVAAVMSMALGHQVQQAQQQIAPPRSPADTTLQAIAAILPSIAQIYGINRQVALGMEQVRGNVAIQQAQSNASIANTASTNNAFAGIAGEQVRGSVANTASTNTAFASIASTQSLATIANTQSNNSAFTSIASKIQAPAADVTNITNSYNTTDNTHTPTVVTPTVTKVDPIVVNPVIVDPKVVNPQIVNPVVVQPTATPAK